MIFSIFDYEISFWEMVVLLIAITFLFLVSLSLRELCKGWAAYKMGDPTPKISGRLTFNPMAHTDTLGFLMFFAVGVGWARPMPINPTNFKSYRGGIAKMSLAGIGANLGLCILGSFFYVMSANLIGDGTDLLVLISFWFMITNALITIFNVLPIYPLDGFNLISAFMPSNSKFVQGNIKYAGRIFMWVVVFDLILDLLFNISILGFVLSWLASYLCLPFCKLWQLIF